MVRFVALKRAPLIQPVAKVQWAAELAAAPRHFPAAMPHQMMATCLSLSVLVAEASWALRADWLRPVPAAASPLVVLLLSAPVEGRRPTLPVDS